VKNNVYTLIYAGILGSVCACLLTAASVFTRPLQQANAEAEKKQNILHVLKVPFDPEASAKELLDIFNSKVVDESTEDLEMYRYVPENGSQADETIAVAFEGPGLWGPIGHENHSRYYVLRTGRNPRSWR
jgi:Na+-transporting NADH:ubiquinone oxidoreductase subunit NqrC